MTLNGRRMAVLRLSPVTMRADMAARPKLTPAVIARVLALVEGSDDCRPKSLNAACGICDVTPQAFNARARDDADLRDRLTIAKAKGQARLEDLALADDVQGPAANVLRHRLSRMDFDAWGDVRINVDGGKLGLADVVAEEDGRPTPTP